MKEAAIDEKTQILLQYGNEETLVNAVSLLSHAQKESHLYKQLGEQRYLSSMRAGNIENAELTKIVFLLSLPFLDSKTVMDAAKVGFDSEVARGRIDVAAKIKEVTGLTDILPGTT